MKSLLRKIKYEIQNKIININTEKIAKRMDNYFFLRGLCTTNNTLDLDKYLRLMKMIKRKYK